MSWLSGGELVIGIAVLVAAVLVSMALGRRKVETPSAIGMALLPISVLLVFVIGFVLVMHGSGLL